MPNARAGPVARGLDGDRAPRVTLGVFDVTPAMAKRVEDVLWSGRLSYGQVSKKFEQRMSHMHGCKHGVLSNSGTSSLVVAIQAMKEMYGWDDGDEVILPALTFVATYNAVVHCGLQPVLADVDAKTYNVLPSEVERELTGRTRLVVPVHLFGRPADMVALHDLVSSKHLHMLEDSCEAVAVSVDKRPVGSWGDVGVFSFYMAHILTAGIGGMSITNDVELDLRMRSLVNHGIDVDGLPTGTAYDPTMLGRNFRFRSAGHSFRVTELESAIGLYNLERLHGTVEQRKHVARAISDSLKEAEGRLQLPMHDIPSSWMVYPIVLRELPAYKVMQRLRAAGIECREMMPLTNQPYLAGHLPRRFPNAERIEEHGFYVGCHEELTPDQIEYMTYHIKEATL